MTKGIRTWTPLIVLSIGIVPAWVIVRGAAPQATKPAPPYPPAKNWTLIVGPDPCQVTDFSTRKSVPVASISKKGKHSIRYKPAKGEELVSIVFEGSPQPFKDVTPAGNSTSGVPRWKLECKSKNPCATGAALDNVPDGTYYKTDQLLAGKPSCDAGIIIQP